jgi:hypothetical protein
MKTTTAFTIVNAAMWLGVTAAIITALILTKRLSVFWFYLIPAFCGFSLKTHTDKEDADNDNL